MWFFFPREKFVFSTLKQNNIITEKIYSLVPFKFWTNKSFITFKYLFKYLSYSIIGKNYLHILVKNIIFDKK